MCIRVGFLVGKEYDFVDVPGSLVDTSFLADLPENLRERSGDKRYSFPGSEADNSDKISADIAIAWHVHKNHQDIEVDIIFPQDISVARLQSNTCNFVIGYDVIDAILEGPQRLSEVTESFRKCGNIMPSWEVQEAIYLKSRYMTRARSLGVPMAPTLFAFKGRRSPAALLSQIRDRGWRAFVIKQSYSAFSLGFKKATVDECEARPEILEDYFAEYAECPEFVVQELIEGFGRNWEIRCFWFNGEFKYAIGNRATVSQAEGEDVGIISEDMLPPGALDQAKRIGREALRALPQLRAPTGAPIDMTLIRTDIGCSDSEVHDRDTHWDPSEKTYFLNEIEYGGTTYFARSLKFDCIPMWAEMYASKAREIHACMKHAPISSFDKQAVVDGGVHILDSRLLAA